MTHELGELIEKCASAAVLARPGDLAALAQLHTDLQSVGAQTKDQPAASITAGHAATLVENLVLGDVDDVDAALRDIGSQVNALQTILRSTAPAAAPKSPAAAPAPQSEEHAAPGQIEPERQIVESDAPLAMEFVGEANAHLDTAEASLLKLEDDPTDLNEVNALFRAFHTIKGVAGFLELKQIGALAHSTETLLDLARKEKVKLSGSRLDVVLEARDMMKQMVGAVETAAAAQAAPKQVSGLTQLLARLEKAAQPGDAQDEAAPARATADAAEHDEAAANITSGPAATAQPGVAQEANVKVSTGRLDTLINTVGELVIAQAMVAQDLGMIASDQRLSRNLSHLGKITRSLQDLSMSMRMVPIAGVFQKMARLVRDVSRKIGKEVEFVQIGGETELDRNVVEAISDPLVHMVRNAIDHGLEGPEDRLKSGKTRAGKLTLKASHHSGNVVIEITDDGRGLPKEKIVKKAIAAGIVKEDQVLTDQEIFQLIFHAGLSTAEKLTDISGRGVGMDVVKKNVEALRGRIEIASTPGHGSIFTVRLPLTLAVIDGLIVKVGAQRYIVPITSIEQSIRPTAEQISTALGRGEMCMIREKVLPIIRLHRLFNVEPTNTDPTQAIIVIVQDGPNRRCLMVDELIGQQQVVIKSVGKEIGNLPGIAGCAILGDGNVSLILDIAGIIESVSE
ncbi:MAG: CheW domain protein [Phycisphaerales bacterium]|nr:CheW domain protein [Phycisphaerales bacterium]